MYRDELMTFVITVSVIVIIQEFEILMVVLTLACERKSERHII